MKALPLPCPFSRAIANFPVEQARAYRPAYPKNNRGTGLFDGVSKGWEKLSSFKRC